MRGKRRLRRAGTAGDPAHRQAIDAGQSLGGDAEGEERQRSYGWKRVQGDGRMIPTSFDYVRASSLRDALSALAAGDGTKVIAGGHSLLPIMKFRLAQPPR